jgi:clan AA aspartic protease (TIGR02281 family)
MLIAAVFCAWRSFATADDKKPDEKPADAKAAGGQAGADPEAFLKQKGLLRVDPCFVLSDEHDVYKQMSGLDKLKKTVFDNQKLENRAEQDEAAKKALIVACLEQRRTLRAQLAQNPPANVYNQIVSQMNELGDRVILLEKEVENSSSVKPAVEAAGKAREAYVEQLLRIRKEIDKLQEKYADLAADPKITAAIADYNQAHNKHLKLGPTASLAGNDRKLKKFEETVLSDSIDIHHSPGELWEASVVINGKAPLMLDIDTGASLISLSYKMAQAAGLTPSDSDPTIELQMADGRIVKAKKVIAKTVRVGKFEVDKVECAVMPADLLDAGSVLGQTFLRNFTYKIDTERSKLVMTRVDSGAAAGAKTPK